MRTPGETKTPAATHTSGSIDTARAKISKLGFV
jgi:hypothetical protein